MAKLPRITTTLFSVIRRHALATRPVIDRVTPMYVAWTDRDSAAMAAASKVCRVFMKGTSFNLPTSPSATRGQAEDFGAAEALGKHEGLDQPQGLNRDLRGIACIGKGAGRVWLRIVGRLAGEHGQPMEGHDLRADVPESSAGTAIRLALIYSRCGHLRVRPTVRFVHQGRAHRQGRILGVNLDSSRHDTR